MLTSCASNIIGTAFPYNVGIYNQAGTNYYVMYNFRQGLSYTPLSSTSTVRDLSIYNSNATAYNLNSSFYYPNRWGGMVYLDNINYNPGAGRTIANTGYFPYSEFTQIVSWEFVSYNGTYGADIVLGAYNSSTHDYWLGQSGGGAYIFSRNGSTVSSGITPVAGRRYIAMINNSASTNTGWFVLYSSAGQSYVNTGIGGVNLSTAGYPALGKYGQYLDLYMPKIYVGDWVASWEYPSNFTYTKANAILQSLKPKLGIP